MTSRGARAARGTAIAVFATFAASLAHTVGGGAPPGPVAVLLALAFSAPLAMLVTGSRARLVRTAVSALVAQAALHLCYAIGGAPAVSGASGVVSGSHAGHADEALRFAAAPASAIDNGHAWMPFAHLIAAAMTVAMLALGDRVIDAIGRAVRMFVRRLTMIPARVVPQSLRVPADAPRQRLVGALLHAALGSRGPPVVFAAA